MKNKTHNLRGAAGADLSNHLGFAEWNSSADEAETATSCPSIALTPEAAVRRQQRISAAKPLRVTTCAAEFPADAYAAYTTRAAKIKAQFEKTDRVLASRLHAFNWRLLNAGSLASEVKLTACYQPYVDEPSREILPRAA